MQFRVHVDGISTDPRDGTPVLILHDRAFDRVLPVWISKDEARSILELGQPSAGSPGSWNLLSEAVSALGARLVEAALVGQSRGRIIAELTLDQGGAHSLIRARAIDAIALAHLSQIPLTVDERLLQQMAHWVENARRAVEADAPFAVPTTPSPQLSPAERWSRLLAHLGGDPPDTTYDA